MNRFIKHHCFCFIFLFLALLCNDAVARDKPIERLVGISYGGMPFFGISKKDQKTGLLVDFVKNLTRSSSAHLTYEVMPTDRVLHALTKQRLDFAFLPGRKFMARPIPSNVTCLRPGILLDQLSLYSHGNRVHSPARVGLVSPTKNIDIDYLASNNRYTGKFTAKYLHSIDAVFKSLALNRIDYTIANDIVIEYWELRMNRKFERTKTIGTLPILFCFSNTKFSNKEREALLHNYEQTINNFNPKDLIKTYL